MFCNTEEKSIKRDMGCSDTFIHTVFFVDESSYGAIQLVKYAGLFVFFRSIFILKSQTFSFYEILDTQIFFVNFLAYLQTTSKIKEESYIGRKLGVG